MRLFKISWLFVAVTALLVGVLGCDPDDGGGKTADAIEDSSGGDALDADDTNGQADVLDVDGESDAADVGTDTEPSDADTGQVDSETADADDSDGRDRDGREREDDSDDRDGDNRDDVDLDADLDADSGDVGNLDAIEPDTYPDVLKPLEPWQCTMEQQCQGSFEMCFHPGQLMCGICMGPDFITPCTLDIECPSSQICDPSPKLCLCSPSGVCAEKCSGPQDCEEGESCAASGHCVPQACGATPDCPANFECTANGCLRRPCGSTDQCEGYCVSGLCYSTAGNCSPPPP